ncbi:MAG: endolytic transglycosylase MltG [Patescibacteria group bacterium]
MKKIAKISVFVLVLMGVGLIFGWIGWWRNSTEISEQAITVIIEPGESLLEIADSLKQKKLIASKGLFIIVAKIANLTATAKAGEYQFYPKDNYRHLLGLLAEGAEEMNTKVTIPEGFTLKNIGDRLMEFGFTTPVEWQEAVGINSLLLEQEFLIESGLPSGVDLEGYLFPDTYFFTKSATALQIATKMIETMARSFPIVTSNDSRVQKMSKHEILTLASIIEKEVRTESSMKLVADIFLKRLEIGMALQADSTVNYITGGNSPGVSLADLTIDSLYNTYEYSGLPPGPISNPGLQAINAVLNPSQNQYYYFLTSADGEIYFAETHEEHVLNKQRYLK